MWHISKRFSLIFTDSSIEALIYNRRHLLVSREFDLGVAKQPAPLLDWLWEQGKTHMPGTICVPHEACTAGSMALPGQQDRYSCYRQIKQQLKDQEPWFDYQVYYDKLVKQTRVYWYVLPQHAYQHLLQGLESAGFNVRGISTVPLMLRYAAGAQADKQGVIYLYQDAKQFCVCVYQNRLLLHASRQSDDLAISLQSIKQQVPIANNASLIACTKATHQACKGLAQKTAVLNTAWDEHIAQHLSEYEQLAGSLLAREWHEFAA